MKTNLALLIQKVIGIVLLLVTYFAAPYADGDVSFALITIPLGLVLLFSKWNMFDDLLEEEDDNYEEEEF